MGWFNHQPVCIHVFYPDVDTLWHKNVSWWVIWCHPVKLKPQMASFTRRVGQRKVNCLIQVKAPPVALSKREEICTVTSTYYRNTNTINVCLDGTLSTLNAMHILSFFSTCSCIKSWIGFVFSMVWNAYRYCITCFDRYWSPLKYT